MSLLRTDPYKDAMEFLRIWAWNRHSLRVIRCNSRGLFALQRARVNCSKGGLCENTPDELNGVANANENVYHSSSRQ